MSSKPANINSICASDLGVKAVFKSESGDLGFRPIVGWVSVQNYAETGKRPFAPIVLNDEDFPVFANHPDVPGFAGLVKKEMTLEQAKERLKRDRPLE
jgi:hypothetical protein